MQSRIPLLAEVVSVLQSHPEGFLSIFKIDINRFWDRKDRWRDLPVHVLHRETSLCTAGYYYLQRRSVLQSHLLKAFNVIDRCQKVGYGKALTEVVTTDQG
jgi:hypothetical protein